MPRKNIIKEYGAEQYYHVYNRGAGKADIFVDNQDYSYMLGLFKKYLSHKEVSDKYGRMFPNYSDKIELVAYCLMPNHYHLLVYLHESDGLEKLMRSVMTSYSRYFNNKHKRYGTLFQNHYLASRIDDDSYFWHISRYIHLNPIDLKSGNYVDYPYSSIGYYLGEKHAEWVHEERIVTTHKERLDYASFLADYEKRHDDLNELKYFLAHE